ncbi:MAG: hypothetical protein ABSA26_05585 [Thermoguttaceae bacterium]
MISGRVFAQAGNADENAAGAGDSSGSYVEDKVDPAQKKNINNIGAILRSVSGKFADDQQKKDFDTYYKTYALARWSQPSTINNLRDYHKDLINNLTQAKSGEVHDYLNTLVLDYMNKLAKNNYHPAVRINAMLTIGDLNSVDSTQPAQNIPLADAVKVLLEAINDPKQIEPVRIAALVGINRHVTAGVNDQIQNQIFNAMLKLVSAANAANPSDIGRAWMSKQAAEIIGLLGNPGTNNQAVKSLSGFVGDAKAPFFLRLTAAESLGKLKYAGSSGLDPAALAKPLGQLMLDVCDAEFKAKGSAADRQRRMKARLGQVTDGLKGLLKFTTQQAVLNELNNLQAIFDGLFKILDKDISKLSDDEVKKYNEDMKKAVEDCQTKLKDWLAK